MIGLKIADQKDFTSKLFVAETFDNFLLIEAEFVTTFRTSLDGQLSEKAEDGRSYALWQQVRPLAFQIIKGKQLPHSFKIVLKLSESNTAKTLSSLGVPLLPEDVGGLFLNIRYENQQIHCITGCSLRTFSLDKTLEKEWDGVICRFLRHHQIPFEEV
ncbi:MAG: DUF5721 family protein [Candidatus Choladocola sp.]|nr:DUF5721 family protein [Candidatus Choladocola sp.]